MEWQGTLQSRLSQRRPFVLRVPPRAARFVVLACLPMLLAVLGALWDEHRGLGFTTWRSACRAAGLSPISVATFTLQLMPMAVIGALLGGLVILAGAIGAPASQGRGVLAAHMGCLLAMPLSLMICATGWPMPAVIAAELALTAGATLLAWRWLRASTPEPGAAPCCG